MSRLHTPVSSHEYSIGSSVIYERRAPEASPQARLSHLDSADLLQPLAEEPFRVSVQLHVVRVALLERLQNLWRPVSLKNRIAAMVQVHCWISMTNNQVFLMGPQGIGVS